MTPSLPYQAKSSVGREIEAADPSIKFQGVGRTCACRTAVPVLPHFSISTLLAPSMKANAVGTMPSPFTSAPKEGSKKTLQQAVLCQK
eukprot:CAMPEP_0195337264 /NCGR_PEP_ID=MMETSP0708-20121125/16793_1 /TAXON_ID=33640 /ORGANISM="Asterionellopsis glacialis, Strain CCMP134" /LENGTH=87 /DNA_ID=CAMNT_0040408227 /DNA_START=92 /DNA_END=355 /DNA_ORIENTATION=+